MNLGGPISSSYVVHCSYLFFTSIRIVFLSSYIYAISEIWDTDFAGQLVYKPHVLSVAAAALALITAILIPADQLVIGPVTASHAGKQVLSTPMGQMCEPSTITSIAL